jgi:uncharacterized protein (UPF0332 family)
LFERRQESDYEDFFTFEQDDVLPWIDDARRFVEAIEKLALNPGAAS